jgi:replicative DNA helicase
MLDRQFIEQWDLNARALLCCIMDEPDGLVLDNCIEQGITSEYFYSSIFAEIYSTMLEIHKTGAAVDEISISTKLLPTGKIESWNITEIVNTLETWAHSHTYIKQVKECYRIQKIYRLTQELQEHIQSGVWESDDLIGHVQSAITSLDKSEADLIPASKFIEMGHQAMTNPLESIGLRTGFPELDETIRGLRKKKYIVLAARPTLGKSSLALNIADSATANSDEPVAIFSLEMPAEEMGSRLICAQAKVDEAKVRDYPNNQTLRTKIHHAKTDLMKRNIFIDDSADINMAQITARARKLKNKHGSLGLIIIDYLQLVTPEKTKESQTRAEKVGAISRACKKLGGMLDVPVLVLAQIGRESEKDGRRPRMSDLRESGSIEQDADIVFLLHQDESMKEQQLVEGIISKHRGGATGIINLRFHKYWTLFEPFTNQEPVQQDLPQRGPKPDARGPHGNVDVV